LVLTGRDAIRALANETIGVDIYLVTGVRGVTPDSGHYFTEDWGGNRVLVVTIGDAAAARHFHHGRNSVTELTVGFDGDGVIVKDNLAISVAHIALSCDAPENADVKAMMDEKQSEAEEKLQEQVGTIASGAGLIGTDVYNLSALASAGGADTADAASCASVTLPTSGVRVCGCRVAECSAGSLIADAIFAAATDAVGGSTSPNAGETVDFAVAISDGIQKDHMKSGPVTRGDILDLLPHSYNIVVLRKVLGSTVRTMLSHAVSGLSDAGAATTPSGRFTP
jgi:2',3'-cyclic-nucleotide 2'-phosphodiesterase (5'-nucleotidase family)